MSAILSPIVGLDHRNVHIHPVKITKQGNLTDVGVWEGEKLLIVLTSHPWIGKLHLTRLNIHM